MSCSGLGHIKEKSQKYRIKTWFTAASTSKLRGCLPGGFGNISIAFDVLSTTFDAGG